MSLESQTFGAPVHLTAPSGLNLKKNELRSEPREKLRRTLPEIYAYDVLDEQDPDILNHGSIQHIQNYFEKKLKEHEKKENGDETDEVDLYINNHDSAYSINTTGTLIKLVIVVIFLWILWDFFRQK